MNACARAISKVILDCHGFRFQAPRNMVRGDLLVRSADDCGKQENPELVGDGDRLYPCPQPGSQRNESGNGFARNPSPVRTIPSGAINGTMRIHRRSI